MKEDGSVFTDWESYLEEQDKEIINVYPEKLACSIDHKGC